MKRLLIATKNKGKVQDFRHLFDKYDIEILSLLDLEKPIKDVEETGTTFEENAILKAETIAKSLSMPVLADDSGLEIDYLDGRPGVYSARYAGLDKNDKDNLHKVLTELKDVPDESRSARFVCVLAVARPGAETITKRGTCEGTITHQPIGENGFGYDPIFQPIKMEKTMAELSASEKNTISHRGNALKKLESWVKEQ
ncbi:Non-canonical purine NTP pyrophosphatase [Paraliobacillus sp. PM-2]|uniref:XTP/dITP diphosphatase n=1 Tax=Paraliobacillus sp. PM-2 TaxID=1462524 RepID=UPI00061BC478|nr:XTP/dITP diphosphatase [Paraliobacillus sp. PM-2]CQR48060.1 Non-canonical purine NTP pyrophosphatase [Paraliobacillus sp. PM-2]